MAGGGRSLRDLATLNAQSGAEVRRHSVLLYNSIVRGDDDMLVTPHLYGTPGYAAPLLHLCRPHL